jgi:hypothetical protein
MFKAVVWICYVHGFRRFLRGNLHMNTTTVSTTVTTKRLRSTGSMAALTAVVALFSTGCTAAEIDQFLTLLKIIGLFV